MKRFELSPVDGRKSFNNKAVVTVNDNGDATLTSYTTDICILFANGAFKMLYDGEKHDGKLTQTTARHLKAFKVFYGID